MLKTNKIVSLILAVVLVVSMFTIAFTSTAALSDGETWVVAGEAGLCGVAWDPSASQNRMSFNPENGNYEITYNGVAAGTYKFKVINGTAWDNPEFNLTGSANYGGGDAVVTVDADGSTVLVGCDGSKAYVSVTAGGDTPVDPTPSVEPSSEAPVTPPTGDTLTIYFQNNWVWPTVEMYYWGGAAGENAAWPGATLTADMIVGKDDSGVYDIYKIEVPADIAGIVFSGEGGYGRDQSEDVTDIQDGYCYYMTWDEPTKTKPCASYPYVVDPSEDESSETPSESESSETPSESESSETPSESESSETPVDPEGLFIKADGTLYEVKQGEKYTYTFYVGADKKICSLDMSVFYDTEGLDPVYPLDSYGDPDLVKMFPVFGDTVVANTEIDGEFLFNYSAAAGKGVPEGSVGVTFDFLVTAESGIYEINTVFRDLAVVGADKEMIVVRDGGVDQGIEGVTYSSNATFDATPYEDESSETPSESESSETPSESESSETPSESESSETPVDPEGLFVKADGVLYAVEQGEKYTYTFYVGAEKKICSLDMSVFYDTEGLDPVYPLDSYGDPDLAKMFPVFGDTVVANTEIDGEFLFNYSAAAGKGVPEGSVGVTFDFLVTAESGIYEINTVFRDLAVVGADKEMIVVLKGGEDQATGVVYSSNATFDATPVDDESSEIPSESESSEIPSESESSEIPSESESSETPSESESSETPVDPEGLFVKADGVLYAVEQGEKYTYTFYVGAEKKICSLDMSVFYDTEGLDPVYPLDSYGDPDLATMFPVFGDTVVANTDIDGEFLFNYSSAAGKGVPEGSVGVTFDFLVTAESGIYEINTVLRDIAVVGADKEMIVVLKGGEDQNTGISYSSDAEFDAPVVPDEPSESESTEIPSESESSEIPSESESSEIPSESESTEPAPVKTYVVADGNWYEVEVGETFNYVYYLACGDKLCALDASTIYDADGLTFNPSTDEYGDDVVADMFPNVLAMVYNYDIAGEVKYNFTSTSGIRFPAGESMTAKNIVFAGSFTVTGEEGGVYYINTALKTLADSNNDFIIKNGEVVNPDITVDEAIEIVGKTPVDEPEIPSEIPSESESTEPSESESTEPSEIPSESESTEPSEQPSSETPSESESTEPSEQPSSEIPSEKPSEDPSEEESEDPSVAPSEDEPTDAPSEEETVPAPATSDSTSTGDGAGNGGNGVQTGTTTTAIAFLAVLVMAAAAVMFARKRKAD